VGFFWLFEPNSLLIGNCSGSVRKHGFLKLFRLYMGSIGSGYRLLPAETLQKSTLPDTTRTVALIVSRFLKLRLLKYFEYFSSPIVFID